MKITYREVNGYLIPNLKLPPEEANIRLGKWGMMYKSHLEKYRSAIFNSLLIQGKLYQHCAEVEKQANEMSEKRLREFIKNQEAWLNEYVEVRLFKDNEKYKDDVYVAINGKNCVIRRGVWTRIRRKFALLLDQSEIQDLRTAELMEREEGRFADESRRRSV